MRIHYFDFLRGLAVLMVVAIHTNPTFGYDSFHDATKVAVRQLLNSAVPLFFAISGYFLASKCLSSSSSLTGLNDISWILKWFVVATLSTTVTILARKYLPASLNLRLGL